MLRLSPRARVGAAAALVLLSVQVGTWTFLGRKALARDVSTMARASLQQIAQLSQSPSSASRPASVDFVLPDKLAAELGADAVKRLTSTFQEFGHRLHLQKDLVPPMVLTPEECIGCTRFSYAVGLYSPLLAHLHTEYYVYGLDYYVYNHWRLWAFGTWITLSDTFHGMG